MSKKKIPSTQLPCDAFPNHESIHQYQFRLTVCDDVAIPHISSAPTYIRAGQEVTRFASVQCLVGVKGPQYCLWSSFGNVDKVQLVLFHPSTPTDCTMIVQDVGQRVLCWLAM